MFSFISTVKEQKVIEIIHVFFKLAFSHHSRLFIQYMVTQHIEKTTKTRDSHNTLIQALTWLGKITCREQKFLKPHSRALYFFLCFGSGSCLNKIKPLRDTSQTQSVPGAPCSFRKVTGVCPPSEALMKSCDNCFRERSFWKSLVNFLSNSFTHLRE